MRKGRDSAVVGEYRVTLSPSAGAWYVRVWDGEALVMFAERRARTDAVREFESMREALVPAAKAMSAGAGRK